MKAMHLLLGPALALAAHQAQAQVSVTATISGQVVPGVYGQVMLGSAPPPPVVYAQPVTVEPAVVAQPVPVQPIYLHVPPDHARHWKEHCHEYHACNRPVYFVKSAEYEPGYRPPPRREEHYEEHHEHHDDGDDRGEHRGHHDDDDPGEHHGHHD